jgi:uncharacterized protein (AIM24 family)
MADEIDYEIIGDDMQLVEVSLDPGEAVRAEAGAMTYMEDGIEMQTSTGGGLFKGFKRMITGAGFFITNFTYRGGGKGRVAFAAPYPGKIVPIDLRSFDGQFICQKDSFLCAAEGIEIEVAFTKRLGVGLFSRLADRIVQASRMGHHQVGEKPGVAGLGANILGGLLSGDR